jgi:hypothetical protein
MEALAVKDNSSSAGPKPGKKRRAFNNKINTINNDIQLVPKILCETFL